MTVGILGSRGLRSHSVPVRPAPRRPEPVSRPSTAPRAPPPPPPPPPPLRRLERWVSPLAGVAAGWLIASVVAAGSGRESTRLSFLLQLVLGAAILLFVAYRRRAARLRPVDGPVAVPSAEPEPARVTVDDRPPGDPGFDEGLRDIRRMDPKFDPARFTGYIEMIFGATHRARASGDVGALRDRVTPELYGELRAQSEQSERLPSLGHASHVAEIEVRAEVTEAWQEDGRDYVTAYVAGSMLDYTVEGATGALVAGSKTSPKTVDAFYTFTRPAGLNPWMLSAIQTAP